MKYSRTEKASCTVCDPQLQRRCFCQAGTDRQTDRFFRETHSRDGGRNSKVQLAAGQKCLCPHISNELQRWVQAPRTSVQYHLVGMGQQNLPSSVTCSQLGRAELTHCLPHPSACKDRKHYWDLPSKPLPVQDRATAPSNTRNFLLPLGHQPLSERQGECCTAIGTE